MRAKWRSFQSARVSTLKKGLTPPALSETRCFASHRDRAPIPLHLVSNINGTLMTSRVRFRQILPASQVPLAALFGGWGLWQRNQILSHDYLFGIGWNSTARFHVWPWPYKFAAVTNFPALL